MGRPVPDYIIVGAGSAGCVLANRLSEDPHTNVLLLEAGPSDRRLIIQMPAAMEFAYRNKHINWNYVSGPEPFAHDRLADERRGRVLGGSSSINGMLFNRGNPLDFEGWAAAGLSQWSWAHCLPYFRKLESFDRGANAWRGSGGPLRIASCKAEHSYYDHFIRAGEQAGQTFTEDQNGFRQEGMHIAQVTIHEGRRWNTANAYLRPALPRRNLDVRADTPVTAIVLANRRAVGVRAMVAGATRLYECRKEVILSAGAIGSPHLLMLSGIGRADELTRHGIDVHADLNGVGSNLENHPGVMIQFASTRSDSMLQRLTPLARARMGAEWLLFRRGLGGSNFFEAGAFLRTDDRLPVPDLQMEFLPMVRRSTPDGARLSHGFQFGLQLCRPRSKGRIALRSRNPMDHPSIVFNHLAERDDAVRLAAGIRLGRVLAAQRAWDGVRGAEITPGADIRNDDDLVPWVRRNVTTFFHPAGTCRMGTDREAVTDGEGRVRGIDGLRVVDASLIPRMIAANLNGPVIMIAEKLADRIRGRAAPPETAPFYRATAEGSP